MLTMRRAMGAIALVIFGGFCVGGWLFIRPFFDDDGTAMNWTEVALDGRMLTINYQGDTCEDERSIEVQESDDDVIVTIFVTDKALAIPFVVGCGSAGESFRVELDRALADRTLLDGACLEQERPREDCIREP